MIVHRSRRLPGPVGLYVTIPHSSMQNVSGYFSDALPRAEVEFCSHLPFAEAVRCAPERTLDPRPTRGRRAQLAAAILFGSQL